MHTTANLPTSRSAARVSLVRSSIIVAAIALSSSCSSGSAQGPPATTLGGADPGPVGTLASDEYPGVEFEVTSSSSLPPSTPQPAATTASVTVVESSTPQDKPPRPPVVDVQAETLFNSGSCELVTEDLWSIDTDQLTEGLEVSVHGWVDDRGDATAQLKLARCRATVAAEWFEQNTGVVVVGVVPHGVDDLRDPGCSGDCPANRAVTVYVER